MSNFDPRSLTGGRPTLFLGPKARAMFLPSSSANTMPPYEEYTAIESYKVQMSWFSMSNPVAKLDHARPAFVCAWHTAWTSGRAL